MPKVSIILPAYNEMGSISQAIHQINDTMSDLSSDYEIIVVDDGSHDDTFSEAMKTANTSPTLMERVKVISYQPNQGKGYALMKGFGSSRGEHIIFIDSDLDISPDHLHHYLNALQGADIVAASKFHPDSKVESPVIRKVMSLGYHWLVRVILRVDISDTQAGLKAFRRSALMKIIPVIGVKQYAFDAEVFAVANLCGFKIKELPVDVNLKAGFPARHIFRMLIDLLGIAYRKHVRRSYQKVLKNQKVQIE